MTIFVTIDKTIELRPRVFADSYTIEIVKLLQEYLEQEENLGVKPHAIVFNIGGSCSFEVRNLKNFST